MSRKMESLVAILEGEFIMNMQREDEDYVNEVMEHLDERRIALIDGMKKRSQKMIEHLHERFWNKVDQAMDYRLERLGQKQREFESRRQYAVDKYKRFLKTEAMKHMEMLKFTSETDAAHLLDHIKEYNERKTSLYEDDLEAAHTDIYRKAARSAFDREEMQDYLEKCVESFKKADDEQVMNLARTVGDSDSQLQQIIEKLDSLFRSRVAVMIKRGEEVETLITEHRLARNNMVKEHKLCDYEDIVAKSEAVSSTLVRDLDESCAGCFGVDKISTHYFELCPESHDN